MQQKNLLLAVILSGVILIGWMSLSRYLWPPPERKPDSSEVANKTDADKSKGEDGKKAGDKKVAEKKADDKKSDRKAERASRADLEQVPMTHEKDLIPLGSREENSRYHLFAQLDPRGGGVRSLWCNKYQAADKWGRPEWNDEAKKEKKLLELIPAHANRLSPSFLLFAYEVNASNDDQPLDQLGREKWTVVDRRTEDVDGRERTSVSLQAETQGVIVTKTFTLTEGEYHLGLSVKMRRKDGSDKKMMFRYQMTGAHGLPVEGKWYTSIFRNALIGRLNKKDGTVSRDLQELRQISLWGGGNPVLHDAENGWSILYAGVAIQYFTSVIVVDNDQTDRDFLHQARPTLERALTKGVIQSVNRITGKDGNEEVVSFVLKTPNGTEETFYVPEKGLLRVAPLHKDAHIAVVHHTGSRLDRNGEYPEIATNVYGEDDRPALWEDDITVRVSTEEVELKSGEEVEHKYLLYHGPVKVSQLFPPPGLTPKPLEKGGVQPELYDRYHEQLQLNTLTDHHSPGFMGSIGHFLHWTDLVIKCTNIMHAVLGYIHALIGNYGLCIIVLTILVRGLMFPLSRKQALMSVRMQQLQPEMKKIQEKYKDDAQARSLAMWDLQRKHGIHPLGSCWVILLQMPIFMGLYYALQESTHFRLAEFWPTWIKNLAAPDMLFSWSEQIPFISRIQDYGSFLYLGPFFNLLPVIAVILMIGQQKMMTPPPTDEQQAMQQKMMKYMMVFFGLMFYKVAAGLCLYFIASSVWGFCERKLLPKKKTEDLGEPTPPGEDGYFQKLLRQARGEQITPAPATGVSTVNGGIISSETRARSGGKRGRNKRRQASSSAAESEDASMFGRWRKRLREWWIAVLKEAQKKNRG